VKTTVLGVIDTYPGYGGQHTAYPVAKISTVKDFIDQCI